MNKKLALFLMIALSLFSVAGCNHGSDSSAGDFRFDLTLDEGATLNIKATLENEGGRYDWTFINAEGPVEFAKASGIPPGKYQFCVSSAPSGTDDWGGECTDIEVFAGKLTPVALNIPSDRVVASLSEASPAGSHEVKLDDIIFVSSFSGEEATLLQLDYRVHLQKVNDGICGSGGSLTDVPLEGLIVDLYEGGHEGAGYVGSAVIDGNGQVEFDRCSVNTPARTVWLQIDSAGIGLDPRFEYLLSVSLVGGAVLSHSGQIPLCGLQLAGNTVVYPAK